MDTNKNKKVLSILIGFLLVTLLAIGTLVAFTYYEKDEPDNDKVEQSDSEEEEVDEELPESSDVPDDEEVKSYISETFDCFDLYREENKATPDGSLVVVYPDNPEVKLTLAEGTGGQRCFMTVSYLTGELNIQYNVGEGFVLNLAEDYETIKTVGSILLVRDPLTYREGIADREAYYSTTYGAKKLDGECVGGLREDLRPPCFTNNHPFMTYTGIVTVTIDKDTSEEDRAKIMEVFDDISARSYSSRN